MPRTTERLQALLVSGFAFASACGQETVSMSNTGNRTTRSSDSVTIGGVPGSDANANAQGSANGALEGSATPQPTDPNGGPPSVGATGGGTDSSDTGQGTDPGVTNDIATTLEPTPTPTPTPTSTQSPAPVTTETVLRTCANTPHQTLASTIDFAPRQGCSWEQNGNLSQKNGFIRAREEQSSSVSIPAGALVCDVVLASETPLIHFDDFFALRANDYLLASSKVLADALTADVDGHKIWDWTKIADKTMQDLGKYCGTGDCTLPEHDTPGAFALTMSLSQTSSSDSQSAMNAALFAKLFAAPAITFTATATGDNIDGVVDNECFHSGGRFGLTIRYVMP